MIYLFELVCYLSKLDLQAEICTIYVATANIFLINHNNNEYLCFYSSVFYTKVAWLHFIQLYVHFLEVLDDTSNDDT